MSAAAHDIATAINQVARDVGRRQGMQKVLSGLTVGAVAAFPEITHAGISAVHRGGEIETLAVSDDLVLQLDQLQYELREGPCYESIKIDPVTFTQYASHETRWPNYMPAAVQRGLRSQLAFRLYTEERTIGGLNLYSTSSDTISDDTVTMGSVFASYATAALGRAQTEEDMVSALSTRTLIGQATGMIMERYRLDPTEAFNFLTRVSSTSNVKLRDVARRFVEGTEQTDTN